MQHIASFGVQASKNLAVLWCLYSYSMLMIGDGGHLEFE